MALSYITYVFVNFFKYLKLLPKLLSCPVLGGSCIKYNYTK